jgi:hypothetical protein
MNKYFLVIGCIFWMNVIKAQELRARVTVITTKVSNNVNKKAFQTLQSSLNNFLNNRKWTSETYGVDERIECNFLLNVESTDELNVYSASLNIQSARPVFNTNYISPIINFKDDNIYFKYLEFQQLDFNENRVAGNDALTSNLTAIFAYYAYMIIGVDAASAEVYEQVRRPGKWKILLENLEWLSMNQGTSQVVLSFTVQKTNFREITAFADCIINDSPIIKGSSDDALKTMKLVFTIYHADPIWRSCYSIPTPN